jgi:hypothetical protein
MANPSPEAMDKAELGCVEYWLWVVKGLVGNGRKSLEFKQDEFFGRYN